MADIIRARSRTSATIDVADSLVGLCETLVEDHGFTERALPTFDSAIAPGLYFERRRDRIIAWAPATDENDPSAPVPVAAVQVRARPGDQRTALTLRRVLPRSTTVTLALLAAASLCCALVFALASMLGAPISFWPGFGIAMVFVSSWTVVATQTIRAYERTDALWSALSATLAPLALGAGESPGPYRA